MVVIESHDARGKFAKSVIRSCLDDSENRTEIFRQLVRPQREPRHDTEAAATAAFEAPEQIGMRAGIRDARDAVGCDHFGFEESGSGPAVVFRKTAEAAALDESSHADRSATAALDVTAGAGGDGLVGLQPDGPGANAHRRLRLEFSRATLANERIVHHDVVHGPRPHKERVGRVGRPLVTVPAAFDDQAQIVLPREVHRCNDVFGFPGGDGEDAWFGSPRIDPPGGLGEGRVIADVKWILEPGEEFRACLWIVLTGRERGFNFGEAAFNRARELVPVGRGWPFRRAGSSARIRRARSGAPATRNERESRQCDGAFEKLASVHDMTATVTTFWMEGIQNFTGQLHNTPTWMGASSASSRLQPTRGRPVLS